MAKRSAGVMLYHRDADGVRVLLVHPGGPFWRNKDIGAWQIPKGQIEPGEDSEAAARREVREELGVALEGPLLPLGMVRQAGGKEVVAFAIEQALDPAALVSTMFELEWPPNSGKMRTFPEVDQVRWMRPAEARAVMLPSQQPLLSALEALLGLTEQA